MMPSVETMRDRRRFHNNEDMLFRWPAAAVIPTSVEPTQHPMIIVITELDVKDVTMSIGIGSAMITVGSRWAWFCVCSGGGGASGDELAY